MLGVRYHPDADAEVIEAALHYEGEREGLGGRFLADLDRTLTPAALARLTGLPPGEDLPENVEVQYLYVR